MFEDYVMDLTLTSGTLSMDSTSSMVEYVMDLTLSKSSLSLQGIFDDESANFSLSFGKVLEIPAKIVFATDEEIVALFNE